MACASFLVTGTRGRWLAVHCSSVGTPSLQSVYTMSRAKLYGISILLHKYTIDNDYKNICFLSDFLFKLLVLGLIALSCSKGCDRHSAALRFLNA